MISTDGKEMFCMGYRWDKKDTVEGHKQLDVRQLKRAGRLFPGSCFSWQWSVDGKPTGDIRIRVEAGHVDLIYRYRSRGQEQWEDVEERVRLVWTPCNYGGERPWFLCPGQSCGRRVAVLYAAGIYFLCRHCYEPTYSCQQETTPFRLLSRAQKLRDRLGASPCIDDAIIKKPKGMHWRTFRQQSSQARNVAYRALLAATARFDD
jgi:hypothetical protein